jgi:hypothetical protein
MFRSAVGQRLVVVFLLGSAVQLSLALFNRTAVAGVR